MNDSPPGFIPIFERDTKVAARGGQQKLYRTSLYDIVSLPPIRSNEREKFVGKETRQKSDKKTVREEESARGEQNCGKQKASSKAVSQSKECGSDRPDPEGIAF